MRYLIPLLIIAIELTAQSYVIQGIIKDSKAKVPLASANIFIEGINYGITSDKDGTFKFSSLAEGNYSITFSYLGYETKILNITLNENLSLNVMLNELPIELETAVIPGTRPKFRETSVAFSDISLNEIEQKKGSREALNILEGLPSTFISNSGGGIGEQRLSLRGFDQQNIAVLLNGIPINNPENGQVYWSNWAGISDILEYITVQRGLSAIPYSTSSIGGSVNFVTNNFSNSSSNVRLGSNFGSNNLIKNSISFSTKLSSSITLSGLVSKRTLDGYADQVYSEEYTYFVSLNMILSDQTLNVQLFGSPQKHGQRLTPQTIENWNKYGKKYNSDWGYLNGKALNLRDNEFHNPTLNLNHNWQFSNNFNWSNIFSISKGIGGGTVPPWYPELRRTENGLIDFDREYKINENNIDENFSSILTRSIVALRKGVHENYWGNLISVVKYNFDDFNLSAGIDGTLYQAKNFNELSNLLGGDFYIGSGNINSDPNTILVKGEKVDFYAESFTRSYGSFIQAEYINNKISTYLNLALSNIEYNRIDYFNYLSSDPKRETGWKSFTSYTVKAGLNYNLNSYNNFYLNAGNFSRAPLSMNVYDYANNLYDNTKNENILSFEIGYGFTHDIAKLNLNFHLTNWKNKAFSQSFINSDSTAIYYYNIFGASAQHSGIEFDGVIKVNHYLSINTMFSYSLNKWTSDIDAYARPEANPTDEIKYHAYTKDLFVGGNPMTSASLGIYFNKSLSNKIIIYINPVSHFYGRYYSQFYPELRTTESDKIIQPWRIPDYYTIDIHSGVSISFEDLFFKEMRFAVNIYNLMDKENIIDAFDGQNHSSETAMVWFGRGRWWNFGIKVLF